MRDLTKIDQTVASDLYHPKEAAVLDFQTFRTGNLHWIQKKVLGGIYELSADEKVIASLSFPSTLTAQGEAENTLQCWTFIPRGFTKRQIVIRKANDKNDFAIFTQHLLGDGTLQLEDGRSFQWTPINFWRVQWIFYQASDTPAVRFYSGSREFKLSNVLKTQADVEILDFSLNDELLCLLISLGFYLLILQSSETAIATAASTSS